jgi:UDP-N-acetylmuramyl pentapeptide phosphotransferase/UDP-N-acetylglucosamine-1-phosphate transferase
MLSLLYLPAFIFILLLYFKLATQFKIIDLPNHRSSHSSVTIRGGGILFPIAILFHAFISGFEYPLFNAGLMLISLVSFYDDLRPLSNKIRLFGHLIAVSLLFLQAGLMEFPLWIIAISFIFVIGTINAYNFMDGINGITGSYSLITLITLYWINIKGEAYVQSEWLLLVIMALLVFNFFNFRKKAKCFAGDVGSVSISFIIIFFILLLILKTGDLKYIALLLIYGLDTITTIFFRLIRKENIFEAHRSHLYQYLANEKNWPHLWVSAVYMFVQLLVNLFLFYSELNLNWVLLFLLISGVLFVCLRFLVEGKLYLTTRN